MKGHIKLGASVADLREYMLTDPNNLNMQLSNQMAAKLGQGAGKYDDLQDWSAWVMDNWSAGAGTVDAEGGGFLFGDVDSRVPRQVLLPPALGFTEKVAQNDLYWLTPHDLTSGGVVEEYYLSGDILSWDVRSRNNGYSPLWLYANIPSGTTVTVKLYSSGGSLLNTETVVISSGVNGYQWHHVVDVGGYSVSNATDYRIDVSANATWYSFISQEKSTPFFIFQVNILGYEYVTKIVRFNGSLYGCSNNYKLLKWNGTYWATVAGAPSSMTDICVYNGKLYIGVEPGINFYYTMSTAEAFTAGAVTGEHFYKWNGYLYRVVSDSLYYSADGSTWTGPFKGEPGMDILGMAGMGNDLYFATKHSLNRFAPGDVIFGVLEWGKYAGTIGNDQTTNDGIDYDTNQGQVGMVNWQGDLYIAVDGQIFRYSANGQTSEIWLKDSGDLPEPYVGKIDCLAVMNNYLVAGVSSSGRASIWAWNKQGWHCLTVLPNSVSYEYPFTYSMLYDRDLGRLWICGFYFCSFLNISDYAQNPYTLSTSLYMPSGWMETHWFDGNLFEIRKDFESVYLTGDTIGANDGGNTSIKVYWMDDESTGWELLGTAAYPRTEIRWSSAATRPNSRQIKIALQLNTESVLVTPKLEAVRIKYMSMLLDRYRWTLPLSLSVNQEMLDNTLNSYTLAQQVTHVNSLINSVAPIYFEDVDGVQYAVKVLGASRSVRDFEYRNPSTAKVYKYVYNIVIEQVASNINT